MATYLTDFIDLSSLLAGLLPGDSFLLRRKASRFFMSLALDDKDRRERETGKVGKRRVKGRFMNTEGGEVWGNLRQDKEKMEEG